MQTPLAQRTRHEPITAVLSVFLITLASAGCISLPNPGADSTPQFQAPEEQIVIEEEEQRPMTFEESILRADQLRNSGQVPEAVWHYLRALRLDDSSPIPRQRIGYMHLGKDVVRAEEIFRELVRNHPQMATARVGLGLAQFANGKSDEARHTLQFALALDPNSAVAITTLGMIEDDARNHELARRHYRRARKLDPSRYEIPNNLGMSYLMTDSFEPAAEAFKEAIYVNPGDPAVYNNLGYASGRMGQYQAAYKSFDRFGNETIALNNTGYTAYLNGDYRTAIQYYERALLLDDASQRRHILVNLRAAEDALLGE